MLKTAPEDRTSPAAQAPQIRLTKTSPWYWRVTFDNPPLSLMGPVFVVGFGKIISAIESDENLRVVVFDSAVEGFFLNHIDLTVKMEELTALPQGPTGLEAWPDILVRITRAPVVSIAKIRARATGNGSEISLEIGRARALEVLLSSEDIRGNLAQAYGYVK